jgi:hypothetical protein
VHDLLIKPGLSERLTDLDMTVTYEAPPGFVWLEVPDDVFLATEFGLYVADFRVQGRVLTCNRSYLMPAQRVTPDKYPRLMEFIRKIADTERQRVAYGRLEVPGGTALQRSIVSLGYARHGGEDEDK